MAEADPFGSNVSLDEEKDLTEELISQSIKLRWSKRSIRLKTWMKRIVIPQPLLITEGQDKEWEPYTNAASDPILFVLGRRMRTKILAQCWILSPAEKCPRGPVFEIDEDYDGWFEIITEDGIEMLKIRNVSNLGNHLNRTFVLMEKVPAIKPLHNGQWERSHLDIGERITVLPTPPKFVEEMGNPRLLVCKSLPLGQVVYLPMEESGCFSMVSGFSFSGPQTVSSMSTSMKFPVNVKLLEGSKPPNDSKYFLPTMRFYRADFDEVLTAWFMKKDVPLVHIRVNNHMQVKTLDNLADLRDLPIYNEILRRIQALLPEGEIKGMNQPPSFQQQPRMGSFPSSSQQQSTSKPYFYQPSYFPRPTGAQTVSSAANIRSLCASNQQTSSLTNLHQPSTSGLLRGTPTHLHQPSTSGLLRGTPTHLHPSTSGRALDLSSKTYFPRSSTIEKQIVSSTTDDSNDFNIDLTRTTPGTNITRPSNSGSPSTSTTYVPKSGTSEVTEAQAAIHQQSTSGLQVSSNTNIFRTLRSRYLTRWPRISKTVTSEGSDNRREVNFAAPQKSVPVKTQPSGTCVDQQASASASVASDKVSHLNVNPERAGDVQQPSIPDASQKERPRPEAMEGTDFQETSNLQSSRIKTLEQRETSELPAVQGKARSKSKRTEGGSQTLSGVRRSQRIKKQRMDAQNQSAELEQEADDQQASGQGAVGGRRSTRVKAAQRKDDQETTDEVGPLETESSSEKDPYDEIDEIYAQRYRVYRERSRIPLEKETFL